MLRQLFFIVYIVFQRFKIKTHHKGQIMSIFVWQWSIAVHNKALCFQVVSQVSWVVGNDFRHVVQICIIHLILLRTVLQLNKIEIVELILIIKFIFISYIFCIWQRKSKKRKTKTI